MASTVFLLAVALLCFCYGPSSLSTYEPYRARVAVDYGPRLVGVASSDFFGNILPICTLSNDGNTVNLCSQILDIARSKGALEIIVGLPLDSNGKMSYQVKNFNGQLCLNFSSVLAATTSVALPRASVLLFDERYTTREAKARIKSEKLKASIDAMSALCLLERYLEDQGDGSLAAIPCTYPPPKELMYFDYNSVREHIREKYYSKAITAEEIRFQVMQNLKEGRRPASGLTNSFKASSSDDLEIEKEAEKEAINSIYDSISGSISSNEKRPIRKTLAGRVVGYTKMNPPRAFHSLIDSKGDTDDITDDNDTASDKILSAVELELLEYEKIKALKRKRGTLKRNHKLSIQPIIAAKNDEDGLDKDDIEII
jgi:putative transcription antitermination factor YqgF